MKGQNVSDAAVAEEYNASDLFELKAARFKRISHGVDGNSYAVEDAQPLDGRIYQDEWIGEQARAEPRTSRTHEHGMNRACMHVALCAQALTLLVTFLIWTPSFYGRR